MGAGGWRRRSVPPRARRSWPERAIGLALGIAVAIGLDVADSAGAARASPSNVVSDGDDIPGPALPRTSGRSSATARSGPATGRSRRPGRPPVAAASARPVTASRSRMTAELGFVELLRDADDGGEQEEGEAERQEDVADRGDVLDDREAGSG